MWISPKPMVDGFVKISNEFRNGCDEKGVTITPQLSPFTQYFSIANSFLVTFLYMMRDLLNQDHTSVALVD